MEKRLDNLEAQTKEGFYSFDAFHRWSSLLAQSRRPWCCLRDTAAFDVFSARVFWAAVMFGCVRDSCKRVQGVVSVMLKAKSVVGLIAFARLCVGRDANLFGEASMCWCQCGPGRCVCVYVYH